MSRFTVVYDACCLYPAPLRDLLIELATVELFRAKWTERIHDEWVRNVLRDRPDLTPEQLRRTCTLMDAAVPDCLVQGYGHLIDLVTLPDPDDRHVVAAAIHGRADAVVTFNLKDFPTAELARFNLDAIHPDDFISYQMDLQQSAVVIAAGRCLRRLRNPPKTAGNRKILRHSPATHGTPEFAGHSRPVDTARGAAPASRPTSAVRAWEEAQGSGSAPPPI